MPPLPNSPVPRFKTPIWSAEGRLHVGNYWEFDSLKLDSSVGSYSDLEYDHNVLVEADPTVEFYCVQPSVVRAFIDGKLRSSRLDAWVQWKGGRQVFREVKYARDVAASVAGDDLDIQLRVQRDWAKRSAENHELITDETIRARPIYLQNWKQILHFLKVHKSVKVHADDTLRLMDAMAVGRKLPIWVLIERLAAHWAATTVRNIIYRQLHSGAFTANLNEARLTDKILVIQP